MYVYIVESGTYYYITPSSSSSCPEESCLSLVLFATNTSQYVHNETDLSLLLVPGIHTLDVELVITNMYKFSISRYIQDNGSPIIECKGQSGRFNISNITFTSVTGLHFIGCGGNFMVMVNFFILDDSIFQGIVGKNRALSLKEVDSAVVVNSTFISNLMGSISSCTDASATSVGGAIAALGSSVHVISSNFTNNSASNGGVFKVFGSSFIVTNSTFTNNIAACGGMLVAFSGSSFIIARSNFANNFATYGGVIQTFNSSFDITSSIFTDNIATHGGVVDSYQSLFRIAYSTFTDNYANYSGVTAIYQSSLDIANSTFARNMAVAQGGVMTTVQSFVSVSDSSILNNNALVGGALKAIQSFINITVGNFSNNGALRGGVISFGYNTSVSIVGSTFTNNSACIGAVIAARESSFDITDSTFTNNKATCHGGVMDVTLVSLVIVSCTFISNIGLDGGVMETLDSSLSITNSNFLNNSANHNGGVMYVTSSSLSTSIVHNIFNNTFAENWALHGGVIVAVNSLINILVSNIFDNNFASFGGVMEISDSLVIVIDGTFNSNTAYYGGVVYALPGSSFNITHCKFTKNGVNLFFGRSGVLNTSEISSSNVSSTVSAGGVIDAYASSFDINYSIFTNNSALGGGVMLLNYHTHVSISNSTFKDNTAVFGGVMETFQSFCTLTSSTFLSNTAVRHGGVISTTESSSFDITNCTLSGNTAAFGAVMFAGIDLMMNISGSYFSFNSANGGGLLDISESLVHVRDSIFDHNLGSLHAFSCNITFSGYIKFDRCIEPQFQKDLVDAITHQGGAITVYGSTLVFTGVSYFSNNKASYGGAILATESTIIMFGETLFTNNTAVNNSGGGIYLHQSTIKVKGNCSIFQNYATLRGGGIHASSTTINVYQPGILQLTKNSAETGGAMYFEGSPRLNLVKRNDTADTRIIFTSNHAKYGGALYVEESTVACLPAVECFIQTLALDLVPGCALNYISTVNIFFSLNSADNSGSNLFGGQLDRCVPSPFAEINLKQRVTANSNGISYLRTISNITLDSIASSPLRICFCNSDYQPNCSEVVDPILAKKGEAFKLTLVAVDQIDHPIDAYVTSLLVSSKSGLGEGQQTQRVYRNCTDMHFNVFSPNVSETIALFANGPCGNSSLSKRYVDIQFKNCTCPVGFEPSDTTLTNCICNCARVLSPYITKCNYTINSLLRVDTTSWITYINDTHPSGYLIHPNCPFDYCYPPFVNVSLNLNLPDGSDSQCAYNRTGMLCGACKQGFSLSLGSSRCIHCYDYWPAVLFTVLLAAVLGGMLLVTAMLALNLTVANGFVSGFIFYGNIVALSGGVFSSSSPKFASVFVSWLNLDIGIDVCFIDGMDTYTRTWLQLAFPLYIISLVIIVIIASRCSPRFARLIGRRDPVATLATLVLLSYAKMLSVIIKALSFAVLYYPDGSQVTVWLADGNVKYCQGKHIALVIVALLIALVGIPYTFLLFLWQWFVQAPKWKLFKWTRNTKLNGFIATYHAPYSSKYRYWTGLLLLVRVVLYVTAVVTESANPKLPPLITIFLVGGLVFLKGSIGMRVYMKWYADILDLVINFNILALAVFSLYDFKDASKQTAVIYTSTIITLTLLVGVVVYHVTLLLNFRKCKRQGSVEFTDYCDASSAPLLSSTEVTHSIVEAPSRCSSPVINLEECEVRLIECDTEKYTNY